MRGKNIFRKWENLARRMKLKENLGLFFFLLLLLGALWNSHFHLSRHNFLTLVINEKVADKFFSRSNSNFVSYEAAATAAADVAECVVQVSLFHFLCSLISQNVSCSVRTADRELPSIHSFIHLLIHLHVFTSLFDDRPAAAVAAAFVAVAVVFIFSSASPCTP